MTEFVKLVVFVPESHADAVRSALGEVGAGRIGNYTHCFFSTTGTGQFLPGDGAHPAIGQVGTLERVLEERIETVCDKSLLAAAIEAVKQVHPYEEIAFDVYPLLTEYF